jgi:coiled-coil domain-containing protein 12
MGDRKARLEALAAKAGRAKESDEPSAGGDHHNEDEAVPGNLSQSLLFRNYAPNDGKIGGDGLGDNEGEGPESKRQRVEDASKSTSAALQDALKEAKQEVASAIVQVKSLPEGIATPKKINWDLMRDIQEKVNKLEKRTQKAIVEMLKERLEQEAAEQTSSDDSDLD